MMGSEILFSLIAGPACPSTVDTELLSKVFWASHFSWSFKWSISFTLLQVALPLFNVCTQLSDMFNSSRFQSECERLRVGSQLWLLLTRSARRWKAQIMRIKCTLPLVLIQDCSAVSSATNHICFPFFWNTFITMIYSSSWLLVGSPSPGFRRCSCYKLIFSHLVRSRCLRPLKLSV